VPDVFTDPAILAVADKVGYAADPDSAFPRAYSGEVRITLNDGRTLTKREHINRGADDRPLSNDDIIHKFDENAGMVVHQRAARTMADALLAIDEATRGTDAVAPLTPAWS